MTAAESELERELSAALMGVDRPPRPIEIPEGHVVFTEGDAADADADSAIYLVLDGILDAEVGGETVGEVGPGAIVGERGVLEGRRTATLTARTKAKLVAFAADALEEERLAAVAGGHRREEPQA